MAGPAPLPTGRTLVMGVLNVTPDSFSDGGRWHDRDAAIAHGLALAAEGADLVDVGGESTRPGSDRVDADVELGRVLPVVSALATRGVRVSVDTTRAAVAAACVGAGAQWVNDVSGGLADPDMLPTVASLGVGYVAMHWRAHAARMQDLAHYDDVVADVAAELAGRRDAALAAGIARDRLVLDPGIGFAKTAEHNWQLLRGLDALEALGQPLLVGVSRKRFLGELLADAEGPREPAGRDDATLAVTALLARRGVWGVRTHSVRAQRDAIAVAARLAPDQPLHEEKRMDERDTITLTGIRARGHHGVYDHERRDGQEFVVDVSCGLARRSLDDEIESTVHYGDLAAAIAADIEGEPLDLIETLAERIAGTCLAHPLVEVVRVTVHKPQAPMPVAVADVAVRVVRKASHEHSHPHP